VGITVAFVLWGVLAPGNVAAVTGAIFGFVITNLGWVFVLATFGFLAFAVYLAASRYGRVRLGGDDEQPEFSTVSWVAMMFSAGMGIGLMFFGVAEPIGHLGAPPHGLAKPGTEAAAGVAMEYSYFHWALHPWAIYAIMGLALAYFTFRRGMPNLISTAFYPLLGDRVYGPAGKTIDILAIFATLFGSATSLGLGALQISGGLNYLVDAIPNSTFVAVAIIVLLTAAFIVSAVSGVHRGIQWIANANMVLAVLLLFFLFVVGPTVFILNTFVESLGGYMARLVPMSFQTAFSGDPAFLSGYTIFYWAWWISWAPFVGTFIARISRGRTIREFVVGVILVPSVVSFVWFSIMGGTAINLDLSGAANITDAAARGSEIALFATLAQFPLAALMSVIAILLVALFFVSGADAAAVVMGMLSSKGILHPRPLIVVIWGVLMGASAAILLAIGGADSLAGLQIASVLAGGPFALVLIGLCWSIMKALRTEQLPAARPSVAPEPGRAMSRPSGAPAPQRMAGENPQEGGRRRA
jgi:choline/carnitine/betaine transport